MSKLTDYVLGYEECSMQNYYERNIRVMGERYTHFPLDFGREAICPLHDDHDPSLGILKSRKSGVTLFKCFGCGRTGTVVDFHRAIRSKYDGVRLNEREAVLELCKMFGIPEPDIKELADDDYEKKFERRMRAIDNHGGVYTLKDFSSALLGVRKSGDIDLRKVGNECVKLIASEKGMVD